MKHVLLPLMLCLCLPAQADDDQDRARAALAQGRILPLAEILTRIKPEGRVIKVEFDEDDGRFEYEIELLLPDGRLLELEIDAETAQILESEYEDDD